VRGREVSNDRGRIRGGGVKAGTKQKGGKKESWINGKQSSYITTR
jgi:hypothetical protein